MVGGIEKGVKMLRYDKKKEVIIKSEMIGYVLNSNAFKW
jgi:hypothetical protein